jgi:Uma2 family endonuclease
MAVATLTPVEQYLETACHPDCDYVDGELLERNVGESFHGRMQGELYMWFRTRERILKVRVLVETRLQITPTRFRIPDAMVLAAEAPREAIVVTPPRLCIGILSRGDSLNQIRARSKDYLSIGVPTCWILDPLANQAWIVTPSGMTEAQNGILRAGEIEMPLADVFEA